MRLSALASADPGRRLGDAGRLWAEEIEKLLQIIGTRIISGIRNSSLLWGCVRGAAGMNCWRDFEIEGASRSPGRWKLGSHLHVRNTDNLGSQRDVAAGGMPTRAIEPLALRARVSRCRMEGCCVDASCVPES